MSDSVFHTTLLPIEDGRVRVSFDACGGADVFAFDPHGRGDVLSGPPAFLLRAGKAARVALVANVDGEAHGEIVTINGDGTVSAEPLYDAVLPEGAPVQAVRLLESLRMAQHLAETAVPGRELQAWLDANSGVPDSVIGKGDRLYVRIRAAALLLSDDALTGIGPNGPCRALVIGDDALYLEPGSLLKSSLSDDTWSVLADGTCLASERTLVEKDAMPLVLHRVAHSIRTAEALEYEPTEDEAETEDRMQEDRPDAMSAPSGTESPGDVSPSLSSEYEAANAAVMEEASVSPAVVPPNARDMFLSMMSPAAEGAGDAVLWADFPQEQPGTRLTTEGASSDRDVPGDTALEEGVPEGMAEPAAPQAEYVEPVAEHDPSPVSPLPETPDAVADQYADAEAGPPPLTDDEWHGIIDRDEAAAYDDVPPAYDSSLFSDEDFAPPPPSDLEVALSAGTEPDGDAAVTSIAEGSPSITNWPGARATGFLFALGVVYLFDDDDSLAPLRQSLDRLYARTRLHYPPLGSDYTRLVDAMVELGEEKLSTVRRVRVFGESFLARLDESGLRVIRPSAEPVRDKRLLRMIRSAIERHRAPELDLGGVTAPARTI